MDDTEQLQIAAFDAFYTSLILHGTDLDWWPTWSTADEETHVPPTLEAVCDISGVSCNSAHQVVLIDWTGRKLKGTIPVELSGLNKLQRLGLGKNELLGSIPPTLFGNWPHLQHLELYRNQLTGPLPSDWTVPQSSLKRVLLHTNQLTGTLDESICTLSKLHGLDLFGNEISGTLPECLQDNFKLEDFQIHDTLLTGTIPDGLCSHRSMNGLDPNLFGCAAVACPMHTYEPLKGRQVDSESPCLPCPTATHLGSIQCHPSTDEPTTRPTFLPTASPSQTLSTNGPTTNPTDLPTQEPTLTPTESPSREASPSGVPTIHPTIAPQSPPVTSTLVPSHLPTLVSTTTWQDEPTWKPSTPPPVPTIGINRDPNSETATTDWKWLMAACVLSVMAMATVIWARRAHRQGWQWKRTVVGTDHDMVLSQFTPPSHPLPTIYETAPIPEDGPFFFQVDEEDSMESDSGWNDTESSIDDDHQDDNHDIAEFEVVDLP